MANPVEIIDGGTGYKLAPTVAGAMPAVISAGSAIIGNVRIDQTTPGTTNGVQIAAAIPAGTNNIGDVDILTLPTQAYTVAVTITRTSDTNAYAANDVIGPATGTTAGQTFALMGPSASNIRIISSELLISAAGIISGETSYRLHLYNITPPSAYGDNVAWDILTGDRASYLGFLELGTPVDLGGSLYVEAGQAKDVLLAGTSLFAYLVTIGGYTPASANVCKITLHAVAY